MQYNYLIVETKEAVGWITINRPQVLNALNSDVLQELDTAVESLANDDAVKILVITGAGKAFIAGADIAQMQNMSADEARIFSQTGHQLFSKIETISKPVIACINGFALGGGLELAMACDIRIASEKAKFGQPEAGLGVIPGFGGTQRLARICGTGKAKELIFTGDIVDAQTALSIGLINRIFTSETLSAETENIAKRIASNGPFAIQKAKQVINSGIDTDLKTGCTYEINAFAECFTTNQPKEGMGAFLEKRKPEW